MGKLNSTSANLTIKKEDGSKIKRTLSNINPDSTDKQIWYNARALMSLSKNTIQAIQKIQNLAVDYEGGESLNVTGEDFYVDDKLDMTIVGSSGADSGTIDATFSKGSLGGGNDTVLIRGGHSSISAALGSNVIVNEGENNTLYSGTGADSIRNSGPNVSINAGSGVDTIENSGDGVTIIAGGGNDSILNTGSNVTIHTGGNTDSVVNWGGDATIYASGGNVTNYGANAVITANTITNYAARASLNYSTKADNITISSYSEGSTIDAKGGNDTVTNYASNVSINAGAGTDRVYNYGDNVTIYGGAGNDTITNRNSGKRGVIYEYRSGGSQSNVFQGVKAEDVMLVDDVLMGDDELANATLGIQGESFNIPYSSEATKTGVAFKVGDEERGVFGAVQKINYKVGDEKTLRALDLTKVKTFRMTASNDTLNLFLDEKELLITGTGSTITVSGDGNTIRAGGSATGNSAKEAYITGNGNLMNNRNGNKSAKYVISGGDNTIEAGYWSEMVLPGTDSTLSNVIHIITTNPPSNNSKVPNQTITGYNFDNDIFVFPDQILAPTEETVFQAGGYMPIIMRGAGQGSGGANYAWHFTEGMPDKFKYRIEGESETKIYNRTGQENLVVFFKDDATIGSGVSTVIGHNAVDNYIKTREDPESPVTFFFAVNNAFIEKRLSIYNPDIDSIVLAREPNVTIMPGYDGTRFMFLNDQYRLKLWLDNQTLDHVDYRIWGESETRRLDLINNCMLYGDALNSTLESRGENMTLRSGTGNDVMINAAQKPTTYMFISANRGADTIVGFDSENDALVFGGELRVTPAVGSQENTAFEYAYNDTMTPDTLTFAGNVLESFSYRINGEDEVRICNLS